MEEEEERLGGGPDECFVALGLVPDGEHSVLKGTQRTGLSLPVLEYFVALGLVPDSAHSVLKGTLEGTGRYRIAHVHVP